VTRRQPRTHRDERPRALLVLVAFALAPLTGLTAATGPASGSPEVGTWVPGAALVHVEGDHVVFARRPADGRRGDAKGAQAPPSGGAGMQYHDGYATYGETELLDHYEVRLVESADVDRLRPYLAEAVQVASAAGGQSLSLRPGTIGRRGPGRGQIDVVVSSSSPCTGQWLGCGGPTFDGDTIESGQIWINPRVFERPADQIANTVRHELGHTLGLAHYEPVHEGRVQTMHPSRFDAPTYESGDVAGLRDLSGAPPATREPTPPSTTTTTTTTTVRPANPVGAVESIAAGPFGFMVRGWAVDPESPEPITVTVTVDGASVDVAASRDDEGQQRPTEAAGRGFELIRLARPGSYEVCVVARNVGTGTDTDLGCETVTVISAGIGRIGLQTV
jgi:hypothetical protein